MNSFELDAILDVINEGAEKLAKAKQNGTYKPMPDSSYGAGWLTSPERAALEKALTKLEEELTMRVTDVNYETDYDGCPNCGEDNVIEYGTPECNAGRMYQEANCFKCGTTWYDIYEHIGWERRYSNDE